jgi:hypothetical protein
MYVASLFFLISPLFRLVHTPFSLCVVYIQSLDHDFIIVTCKRTIILVVARIILQLAVVDNGPVYSTDQ